MIDVNVEHNLRSIRSCTFVTQSLQSEGTAANTAPSALGYPSRLSPSLFRKSIPDVMRATLNLGRQTQRIMGGFVGRGRIETHLHKHLLQIQRIRPTRADPLHIEIAMLIAEIATIAP
jgi:hypothetical protein